MNAKASSMLFRTKLNYFEKRELRKSVLYLFIGTIGLTLLLSFAIFQQFQLEKQVEGLRTSSHLLQNEVKKNEQKKNTQHLLKDYPASGLGLEKTLPLEQRTIEEKELIEKTLSERLLPYIENTKIVLSSGNESGALNVLLTGEIEPSHANLVILGQNISAFMREMEQIKTFEEVYITIVDYEGNDLYKGTYLRSEKGEFTFQSEMRKGKG